LHACSKEGTPNKAPFQRERVVFPSRNTNTALQLLKCLIFNCLLPVKTSDANYIIWCRLVSLSTCMLLLPAGFKLLATVCPTSFFSPRPLHNSPPPSLHQPLSPYDPQKPSQASHQLQESSNSLLSSLLSFFRQDEAHFQGMFP
jgi:hypothetical protein